MTGIKALGEHNRAMTSIRGLFQSQKTSKCKLSAGLADICSPWEEEMRAEMEEKDQSGSERKNPTEIEAELQWKSLEIQEL